MNVFIFVVCEINKNVIVMLTQNLLYLLGKIESILMRFQNFWFGTFLNKYFFYLYWWLNKDILDSMWVNLRATYSKYWMIWLFFHLKVVK